MKKIVVKNLFDFESEVSDCMDIVNEFAIRDYTICLEQAYLMWENYSLDHGVPWQGLPLDKSTIVAKLKDYFDAENESHEY